MAHFFLSLGQTTKGIKVSEDTGLYSGVNPISKGLCAVDTVDQKQVMVIHAPIDYNVLKTAVKVLCLRGLVLEGFRVNHPEYQTLLNACSLNPALGMKLNLSGDLCFEERVPVDISTSVSIGPPNKPECHCEMRDLMSTGHNPGCAYKR